MTGDGFVAEKLRSGKLVKICGLREPDHAVAAATAGADLLGFIFAPARRRVTAETARACIGAAREAGGGRRLVAVGVFVDEEIGEIARTVRVAGLDVVQLSGNESPEFVRTVSVPALKAIRPRRGDPLECLLAQMESYCKDEGGAAGFLIDSYAEGAFGGTGERADWDLAAAVNEIHPIMLAGGLDPGNVAGAIEAVKPLGVDVSSGVERDGVKDPALIEKFVRAARASFARQVALHR